MDKNCLQILSLCQRAGKLSSGEFQCEGSLKSKKAKILIIALDASENTKKKFQNSARFYKVPFIIESDKNTLGLAIGKAERSVISIDDEGFAKKFSELMK